MPGGGGGGHGGAQLEVAAVVGQGGVQQGGGAVCGDEDGGAAAGVCGGIYHKMAAVAVVGEPVCIAGIKDNAAFGVELGGGQGGQLLCRGKLGSAGVVGCGIGGKGAGAGVYLYLLQTVGAGGEAEGCAVVLLQAHHNAVKDGAGAGDARDIEHGRVIKITDPHGHGILCGKAAAPVVTVVGGGTGFGRAGEGEAQAGAFAEGGGAGGGIAENVGNLVAVLRVEQGRGCICGVWQVGVEGQLGAVACQGAVCMCQ